MRALREMSVVVDLDDHHVEVQKMFLNNVKRSGGRTPDIVLEHTARGYGAEIALVKTGLFNQVAGVVDDADKDILFEDRMRDLICEDQIVSVKTTKDNYRYFYVTEAQYKSILNTREFCDVLIVVSTRAIGPNKWLYKPKYLIDNKVATEYIKYPVTPTPWNSRIFMAERARDDGACVILDEKQAAAAA